MFFLVLSVLSGVAAVSSRHVVPTVIGPLFLAASVAVWLRHRDLATSVIVSMEGCSLRVRYGLREFVVRGADIGGVSVSSFSVPEVVSVSTRGAIDGRAIRFMPAVRVVPFGTHPVESVINMLRTCLESDPSRTQPPGRGEALVGSSGRDADASRVGSKGPP